MDLGDDLNVYEDIEVPHGCNLLFGFSLQPFNASGCTASFFLGNTSGSGFTAYPLPFTLSSEGGDDVTAFEINIPQATMGAYAQGLFPYYMRIQYTDSSVGPLGYGQVIVGP